MTTPSLHTPTTVVRKDRKDWRGWIFVGPFLVVFAIAFLAPVAYALYLSVFRTQLVGGTTFVGLDNYIAVFQDGQFWQGFLHVALFLIVQVPIMLLLALVAALAIDSARL